MRKTPILGGATALGLLLSGCAGQSNSLLACQGTANGSPECQKEIATQDLVTACNGYANALFALSGMRSKLSAAEQSVIDTANPIAQPMCHGAPPTDLNSALGTVQRQLAKLQAVEAAHPAGK